MMTGMGMRCLALAMAFQEIIPTDLRTEKFLKD